MDVLDVLGGSRGQGVETHKRTVKEQTEGLDETVQVVVVPVTVPETPTPGDLDPDRVRTTQEGVGTC